MFTHVTVADGVFPGTLFASIAQCGDLDDINDMYANVEYRNGRVFPNKRRWLWGF